MSLAHFGLWGYIYTSKAKRERAGPPAVTCECPCRAVTSVLPGTVLGCVSYFPQRTSQAIRVLLVRPPCFQAKVQSLEVLCVSLLAFMAERQQPLHLLFTGLGRWKKLHNFYS